jgi:DNA end-binding protein Ku
MRAAWTGSISFGLVNIPVRLYSASTERALNFRLLDRENLSPVKYQKVAQNDRVIGRKDVVRGYEMDGQYVVLDNEDLKQADTRKSEIMEIMQFTDPANIDPIYYDKPYYVEPEKESAKAYALLRDALESSGKVGIAQYVLRDKEHLGAISVEGRMLLLEQLRYQDEIRDSRDIHAPQRRLYSEDEMDIALKLIARETRPFNPSEYRDTFAQELRRVIAQKAKGQKPKSRRETPIVVATDVAEILEMLKKSLERQPAHKR